jgi:flagellar hook assembly protein FlgD
VPPAVFAFHAVNPNPSAAGAAFAFDLPTAGEVHLAIFDASGRLLRTLARGRFAPGRHTVRWDGTIDRGRNAPAGVYFARLDAAGRSATRRLLRLK